MTKQRLEKDFKELLKKKNILHHKIYHIAGAYTAVPGDFFVFLDNEILLVECKECRNNRWTFSRLTQDNILHKYNQHPLINSYILVCFWNGRKTKSQYYMIPYLIYKNRIESLLIKSLNDKDFFKLFNDYLRDYKNILEYI